MNYSLQVRERIRLDHEHLRAASEGAMRLITSKVGDDVNINYYVINFVNETLDAAFEDHSESEFRHISRDNITRRNGLKDKDNFAISYLIDYIDQFCDEDYRDVVDSYIENGPQHSVFDPPQERGKRSDGDISFGPAPEETVVDDTNTLSTNDASDETTVVAADKPESESTGKFAISLRAFSAMCDKVLLFPAFSLPALSLHFTFAAFYTFFALALTWALSGISDIGNIPILPTNTGAGAAREAEFDIGAVIENRLFVLSVIIIVVMIFAIGVIAALTAKQFINRLIRRDIFIAPVAAFLSAILLWYSGMHEAFAFLFAGMMSISLIMAGRLPWRTLVWAAYPVAFVLNISFIVIIGAAFGSVQAAGGLLPVLSLLALVIGAVSGGRHGGVIASAVTVVSCLILAVLNIVIFDSWFRIDPWDPGTVVVLLIIPVVNGFWDWVSTSTTRVLTTWALRATEAQKRRNAIMIYVAFVLVDLVIAFLTIIGLYLLLYYALVGYNIVAFGGDQAVSLNAYFQGFEQSLFSERALLVAILLVTVLLPTILHVHLVSRVLFAQGGAGALWGTMIYIGAMSFAVVFLLNTAQGILRIIFAT